MSPREWQHQNGQPPDRRNYRAILVLAQHPHIGRRRDYDLRPGLRSFPVGEYVIVYRIESEDILILHTMRGSRDIAGLLGE